MGEETLTYDLVECIRDYKFGRSALNRCVYHVFTSRERITTRWVVHCRLNQRAFYSLTRESCSRRTSTYSFTTKFVCFQNIKTYESSDSSEVAEHWQYLVRFLRTLRPASCLSSSNIIASIFIPKARGSNYDKVRSLITPYALASSVPFSSPSLFVSVLNMRSNVQKLKFLGNNPTGDFECSESDKATITKVDLSR